MDYICRISDDLLICTLTPDRDLSGAVLCFSGMAPMAPVAGGMLQYALGSYTEVALPELRAGMPHAVHIRYQDGFEPANRAWMPLGPYLRVRDEIIVLPPTERGRRVPPPENAGEFDGLQIVPQPNVWAPSEGYLLTDGFCADDVVFDAVADLAMRQGMAFVGQTRIKFKTADLPDDGYSVDIAPDGVTVTAGSYGGRFYAGITLLTLLQSGQVPCGRIEDAPRFSWRGQHLDTARHFYQPDTILRLLDLMALLKLNRFHWHFADDEAFRLETDCHPALWKKTKLRGEGQVLPGLFSGQPVEGGSYSKDTARAIIAHAKRLNIEVMPEIEAPAHALAIATIYPDTRDPDDKGNERSVQGYVGNALNPAQPRTWEVLEDIAREVGDLFPFGVLHLGCDELPADTWLGSPLARDLMAREGLETTKDLQGWTIAKLAASVVANGQRPAAWEEAAQGSQGGIGHNAILFSWTGQEAGVAAARAGYDVVMTPAQHVYFDMAHTGDVDDWGAKWATLVDLTDTINWDPVPDPAIAEHVIGVQGAFWSEFTNHDSEIWPMLMPRMLGLSCKAWQAKDLTEKGLGRLSNFYAASAEGVIRITPPK